MEIIKKAWMVSTGTMDYVMISDRTKKCRALAVGFIDFIGKSKGVDNIYMYFNEDNINLIKQMMVKGELIARDNSILFKGDYISVCYPINDMEGLVVFDEQHHPY